MSDGKGCPPEGEAMRPQILAGLVTLIKEDGTRSTVYATNIWQIEEGRAKTGLTMVRIVSGNGGVSTALLVREPFESLEKKWSNALTAISGEQFAISAQRQSLDQLVRMLQGSCLSAVEERIKIMLAEELSASMARRVVDALATINEEGKRPADDDEEAPAKKRRGS